MFLKIGTTGLIISAGMLATVPVDAAPEPSGITPVLTAEWVDTSGVLHTTEVIDGVTTISAVVPFSVEFSAIGTVSTLEDSNTVAKGGRGNLGIFTTDDYSMARTYVRKGRVSDFAPPTSQDDLEELGFQFERGYILAGNDIGFFESKEDLLDAYELEPGEEIVEAWKVFATDGYQIDGPSEHQFLFPSLEQATAAAAESFSGAEDVSTVYAGFVNLRNPVESDFEGALFNGSRDHQWVVEVGGEIQATNDGVQYFNDKDDAAEFAKTFVAEDDEDADPYDYVRAADEHYETTDGVVMEARRNGNDGAIIRNVIDDGGGPGSYAMEPRNVFVALKPRQIKSAEWNTGEFGDVDDLRYSKREQDPADGDKTDVAKLPAGKPVPSDAGVGSLEQSLAVARSGKYTKGRDLKVDLQKRVEEASAKAGVDLTERTQENHKFLAGMVRRDAEFALKDNQNAVGWYDSKVSRALGALATLHPEIESDPKARLAFLWALATTSNGLKVNKNFELAEQAYQGWKTSGRMPDNVGIGNAAQQINRGLGMFNTLSDKLGAERLAKFMSTEFGAGEIERMLGVTVGGEWKSTPVRGAAILGPKIGNGFFSNLNGYFGALTMDRWLMRTWGRMTGTLIEVDQKMVKASRARLADRIAAMDDAQRRLMTQLVKTPIKRRMTIAELDAAAGSTAVATMKVNIREQMMANPKTDEFRRAAINHQVQIDGQKEVPAGPGERNWIRAVFHKALGDLNEVGISMTMSDLQALLWYPERRLYDTAKAADEIDQGYSDDEAPDYANAAMALALANGADLKDVMAAMDRAEKRGTVRGEQLTEAERAAMLKEFRSAPKQPVQMAFEVAPDPADNAAIDAWGQLTTKERTQITSSVRDDVLSDIAALVGVPLQKVAPATGGYMGLVNPSLIAEYQKTKVSLEQARALASAIGYVLDQDSVALMDPRVESKAGLIRITFSGKVEPHAQTIYDAIRAAVPSVQGFTARGNNFDVLNFASESNLSNEDLADLVVDVLHGLDIPMEFVASSGNVHSELVEKESYERLLQGARPGSGSEIRTGANWLRDRARKAVKQGVQDALDARRARRPAAARVAERDDGRPAESSGGDRQRGSGLRGGLGAKNDDGPSGPKLSARSSIEGDKPGSDVGEGDSGNGRQGRAGRTGRGRGAGSQDGQNSELDSLPGAPTADKVGIAAGPDPRLVEVAAAYARSIGITLRRQSEYVQVDEERARRIAQAYEAMPHAPQDPIVKEAYQNLIRQTRAQYDALVAAGYRFWFADPSVPSNIEYLSTPWNAMRDIRANQVMGIFPTKDGFGSSEEFDPANNPLLEDTGLTWPNGGLDGAPKRVLANDLFRAVHDAFGHGLEGAGFRAQGEENAWQAHARLFTGSAIGAITSETHGQNSWLNYGPHGESNRTAKVEETKFADQKTGLMPSWTWTEGRAGDVPDGNARFSARTDTTEFKAWFGDSKVVDYQGRPLVVYHGTMSDFSIFQSPADRGGEALAQAGMYFSEDSDLASAYSALRGGGAIMPAYLSIKRPLDLTSASTISGWKGAIAKLIAPRMAADVMREEALRNSTHQSIITKAEREKLIAEGYDGIKGTGGVWIAFSPEQIKSAIGNNGDFDAGNPDIRFSARAPGELFFSELANQVEKSTMKQAAAGAWKSFIKALPGKGVKADEIEWTGINEWLDLQDGKVSKDAVLDYLRANGVQVQEVTLDGKIKDENLGRRQQLALAYDAAIEAAMAADVALNPQYIEGLRPEDRKPQEQALLDAWIAVSENPEEDYLVDRNPEPKYGQYTLPGGQNYREVLLTLPAPETGDQILARLKKKYPDWKEGVSYRDVLSASDQAAFEASLDAVYGGKAFRSSHWDQLNVLAHIRVNDRTDAEGRKVLFVEELQSDFAQDFRKSRQQVEKAVEDDFLGIVERMKKAGVLQVDCD